MSTVTPIPAATGTYTPAEEQAGALLAGRYRLLEKIGEGGMGEVWVARQDEPVKRKVALKLIKPGMDSKSVLARFEQERQALAIMDHPHIAKVLDAGVVGSAGILPASEQEAGRMPAPHGRPFFVMELVNGLPLTRYCDEAKLGIRERLELFVPICQAVQHAHQKGVIHRDLKPSNILVTLYDGQPSPKVIDFGVAKAIGGNIRDETLTQFGGVVGTLEYMAPEQASYSALDVDTRADIYSLGVLLYELLTGLKPFDGGRLKQAAYDEVLRILREEDPPRPSTRISTDASAPQLAAVRQLEPKKLCTLMRGELDWIVMKCLEKDRNRRYETASGLARDLERFLADEPVEARPPTLRYRARKFLRRNRIAVSVAGGFALLLVAGVIGLSIGLARLNQANADIAASLEKETKAKQEARTALDELVSQAAEDWLAGAQVLTADQQAFLERALARYEQFAQDVAGDLASRVSVVYAWGRAGSIRQMLGQSREAETAMRRAQEQIDAILREYPDDMSALRASVWVSAELGRALAESENFAAAEPELRRSIEQGTRLYEETNDRHAGATTATALNNLSVAYYNQQRFQEAEQAARASVALRAKLDREKPTFESQWHLANARGNLANSLSAQGRAAEAAAEREETLETWRQLAIANPTHKQVLENFALNLQNWANLLDEMQRPAEAEEAFREALPLAAALAQRFPSDAGLADLSATIRFNLASKLVNRGRHAEAIEQLRIAVDIRQRLTEDFPQFPSFHVKLARTRMSLAESLYMQRDHARAASESRRAIKTLEQLLADRPQERAYKEALVEALGGMCSSLREDGKLQEAESAARRALELARELNAAEPGQINALVAEYTRLLGEALSAQGKLDEAEGVLRELWKSWQSAADAPPSQSASLCMSLARISFRQQDWQASEEWCTKAIEFLNQDQSNGGRPRRALLEAHWHRAAARVKLKRHAEAVEDWDQTIALDDSKSDTPWFRAHRAYSLHQLGEKTRAANEFAEAVRETQAIVSQPGLAAMAYYDAAAVYALAAAVLDDQRLAGEHGAQAVTLLKQAAELGYFRDPAMLETLKTHDDYAALRERDDYKALIGEIESQ